tara:strand:- start:1797 stop:2543 length:747 start_codon:yes stop_codon:yes gene_type:complete
MLLAKKWQDVEFVDYKERQKRRRMRKRVSAEEELSDNFRGRWNTTLIVVFVTIFLAMMATSAYYLLAEDELDREMESKMYIQSRLIGGDVSFREFVGSEYESISLNQKIYNRGQFVTQDDSFLEMSTFDGVVLKLRDSTDLIIDAIEVFADNQKSKITSTLDDGEIVFDSRKSGGLVEVRTESINIYAARALFKVSVNDDRVMIKVSQGLAKIERFDEVRNLAASQMVELSDSSLSNVKKFNPLTETW